MDIKIIVFSQTGNTRKVAQTMADTFKEGEHTVQIIPMKKIKPEDKMDCDLIGIGCPTFECQAPSPVKKFLKSLPELKKQKAFVFATGAGAPGKVVKDLTKLLKKKGAYVVAGLWTRSVIHHPAPCLLGKSQDRPNKKDLDEARNFAKAVAESALNNNPDPFPKNMFNKGKSRLGFYNIVGGITSNKGLVRLLLPEPKHDQGKCNRCKLCSVECPVNNISMEPYPVTGSKCIRCYRCQTACPNDGYNTNWWFGNLVCLALWNETFMGWFGDYNKKSNG